MHPQRVEAPTVDELAALEQTLSAGTRVVVQFSAPPYPAPALIQLNRLARQYGVLLDVRFYGHYGSAFDCSTLTQLRDVASLSLDCLSRVQHLEKVASLERLTSLSLGVFELDHGAILDAPNLRRLSALTLGETRKSVFDLAALTEYAELSLLRVCGHTKNLQALGGLHSVSELWLNSIPKRSSLAFVSHMRGLRSLHVYLGGRESLAEIQSPSIETLEVVRVRGLRDLGALSRFPALKRLLVEDQLQLEQVSFGVENAALQIVHVYNCKSLRALTGIDAVQQLTEIQIFRTAIEPEALRRTRLPQSLRRLAYSSGKASIDRRVRAEASRLGYDAIVDSASVIGIDWRSG